MKTWTKTAGLLFMAAASVYADRAIAAKGAKPANSPDKAQPSDVKLLEDNSDPFAVVAPTTAPSAGATATAGSGGTSTVSTSSSEAVATTGGRAAPVIANADGTFSL